MSYKSVIGETISENIVEKSKFITYVAHTESEEEAREYLAKVHALHPLATHVCYAYVADKTGNVQRFSDDGEPQGTAGIPILNVIKAQKLYEVTVAVVRYFGGIKLGAGGLTRTYSSSAADGCSKAPLRTYDTCVETEFAVDYAQSDAMFRFLEKEEAVVLDKTFSECIRFLIAVKEDEWQSFCDKTVDYLGGKVQIKRGREYFYPFPTK